MTDKITVSKSALFTIVNALMGPSHHIRELQATMNLPRLKSMDDANPIMVIYEECIAHEKALKAQDSSGDA